jgi:predicted permease
MSELWQHLRLALRNFRKYPGYAGAALITLALGIGANTAIYSVIDAVLLHPVPFPDPDRLAFVYQTGPRSDRNSVTYPNLLDWQRSAQSFEAIAGVRTDGFTLQFGNEPEAAMGMMVSSEFFSVLGIQPVLGRTFTKDEDRRGAQHVVMIGEDFWRRRFGGDRLLVGKNIVLDGQEYLVIGVVPRNVRLQRANNTALNDVFLPLGQYDSPLFYQRGTGFGTIGLARLKPEVSLGTAQAEMSAITRSLAAAYPNENASVGANVVYLAQDVAGDLKPTLVALAAAVGFVLLIACANVANLALARSAGRRRNSPSGLRWAPVAAGSCGRC